MKIAPSVIVAIWLASSTAMAAESESSSSEGKGIPLSKLVADVAKRTAKKFIVDPRVRADAILIGVDTSKIDYSELLLTLEINGFVAMESEGHVLIMPDAMARQMPTPLVTANKQYHDSEMVTQVIRVKSMPAENLVPPLRPLLPQYAHLSVISCANSLLIVDRFANVKRVIAIIETLDKGEPYKSRDCTAPTPKNN